MRRPIAHLLVIAAGAGGILGWLGVFVLSRDSEVFVQDWIVYYAAAAADRAGALATVFDAARFTEFQHALLAQFYAGPVSLHPFLYPPHYLLLLLPFALLPFLASYAAFQLATGAGAVAALAWRGVGRGMAWPRGIMLLCCPAACANVLTGQNGLLTAALMIGGVRLLASRPALAGLILGGLSCKPQFFLLVPVALAAARAWRALGSCVLGVVVMIAASALLFGTASWLLWFDQTVRAQDAAFAAWFADTFLRGFSLYVCAALLGAPDGLGKTVQLAASLGAAAAVGWAFRRPIGADLRLAVLLIAAIVAAPHVQSYDLVLLGAAVILLFADEADVIGIGTALLFAAAWTLPLLRPYGAPIGRVLVPAVFTGLAACALARPRPPQPLAALR